MTATTATPGTRTRSPFDTDERLLHQHRVGPVDRLPAGGILALLPQLPDWPAATVHRTRRLKGAGTILDWLNAHPGGGWQDRWTVSGADRDTSWIAMLAPGDTRQAITKRQEHIAGLGCLLMCGSSCPVTTSWLPTGRKDCTARSARSCGPICSPALRTPRPNAG